LIMIIDLATYNSTSAGSGKKIACRCDVCGLSVMLAKQKIVARGGVFDKCRRCFYNRNKTKCKEYIVVSCLECGKRWNKRKDSIKKWLGFCKSCASKKTASLEHVKIAMSLNGKAVMARVVRLPHYPHNYRSGPANNKWRGGITPINSKLRQSIEMKEWRKAVFERDSYTCQICGERGGNKQADHILPFALYPELRFCLENGRTLCISCHRKHGAKVSNGRLIKPASGIALNVQIREGGA